jgi:hypothetical protein
MHNTELTDQQKIKVEEILSSIITNKERPYEPDIRRASVILYELNRMGFTIVDLDIDEIMNTSKEKFSDTIKQQLKTMANSYAILVEGMKNTDESDILINRVNSIFNK